MEDTIYRDVDVLMRLVDMRSSPRLEDAFSWMRDEFDAKTYEEFNEKYPRGSQGRLKFISVCNFFELCGILVNRHILEEDLFFDIGFGLSLMWQKIKAILAGYRKVTDVRLWENIDILYMRNMQWKEKHPPKLEKT